MRRVVIAIGLLGLLLPMVAWASGIDIVNKYGTVTITDAGIVSSRSEMVGFNGIFAPPGRALGSVRFSTGALTSGDLWSGGTFSSAGSSFLVTGVGNYGQPKGVIFNGAFVGPITWTVISHGRFNYVFALAGKIQGQIWNGRIVTATTTQTIYVSKNQWLWDHKGTIGLGRTKFAVPEPGTLGLLGTGLFAIAGAMRRRFFGA